MPGSTTSTFTPKWPTSRCNDSDSASRPTWSPSRTGQGAADDSRDGGDVDDRARAPFAYGGDEGLDDARRAEEVRLERPANLDEGDFLYRSVDPEAALFTRTSTGRRPPAQRPRTHRSRVEGQSTRDGQIGDRLVPSRGATTS